MSLAALSIDAAAIVDGRVLVAVDAKDTPLGVTAVGLTEDSVELTHLFVEPGQLGQGIGAALFAAALRWTRNRGRRELLIASDPNAIGFYERMGAVKAGLVPSDAIPGRMLPLLRCSVPRGCRSAVASR